MEKNLHRKNLICKHFYDAPPSARKEGQCKIGKMNCKKCDRFELTFLFWCERNSHWLDISICRHRQETSRDGCQRCSQGAMINRCFPVLKRKKKLQRRGGKNGQRENSTGDQLQTSNRSVA